MTEEHLPSPATEPVPAGPAEEQPPDLTGLALVKDVDHLEMVEQRLLQMRLSGQEHVETYLYVIMPDKDNRLPKPVVGPTADFVQQLVRRLNKASKGKVDLQLLPEPPVVTDFTVPDAEGRPRPRVRVIVGAVDRVTGEVRYGIKEVARAGVDPVGVAYTKAIRRAFEIHPSYNRKTVARFIREKLRELGYDPQRFIIVGERGGGEWDQFFAMARGQGVRPDALRAAVREKTGKGLSQVSSAQEADRAAQAIHETVQQGTPPAAPSGPAAGAEGSSPADGAHEGARGEPAGPAPAPGPAEQLVAAHRQKAEELIAHLGLAPQTVDSLKRKVGVAGDWQNWARLRTVLEYVAAGMSPDDGVRAAFERYPRHAAAEAAG
jgi:hypothetical protein